MLSLANLIAYFSPAYGRRRLEILFYAVPHSFTEYCAVHFNLLFKQVRMPPFLVNEQGRLLMEDYLNRKRCQEADSLKFLSHRQTIQLLQQAKKLQAREEELQQAKHNYQTYRTFSESIRYHTLRSKYYCRFFCNILPDQVDCIPVHIMDVCLERLDELDRYIGQCRTEAARKKDLLLSLMREWPEIQGIRYFSLYQYHSLSDNGHLNRQAWYVRKLIWNFKANGQHRESLEERMKRNRLAVQKIIPLLERKLKKDFGKHLPSITLACVPASTRQTHELRYSYFAEELCRRTGMENIFPHIGVQRDGEAKHTGGSESSLPFVNPLHVQDKQIIMVDDVITKGNTIYKFKRYLEYHGAFVIGACSIGKTTHTEDGDRESMEACRKKKR